MSRARLTRGMAIGAAAMGALLGFVPAALLLELETGEPVDAVGAPSRDTTATQPAPVRVGANRSLEEIR